MSMVNEWQNLKISFDEIEVATEHFKTFIGRGGYGSVFKGKLLVSGKETMVAVKRLNEQFGQGLKEFLTEIQLLFGQQHQNLISLVGYCDEGKEKSIVYEYAERGSLDQYIRRTRKTTSTTLTWLQRLKICVDVARGLNYLHSHVRKHQTIIHRDIKSSNILIDENWVGKISDFGLSKFSVTDFGMSVIISNGCGTPGYCEPEYYVTGFVTKKSDVYSFGVVLFEVLCGRLCIIDRDDGFTLSGISAKEYYKHDCLDMIIDQSLMQHMGSYSMTKFAAIAYRCLHDDRKQRPTMEVVLKELEEALKHQEEYEFEMGKRLKSSVVQIGDTNEYWETKLPKDLDSLIRILEIPNTVYSNNKKLFSYLQEGTLFDGGSKFLWISDEGKKCLLISSSKFTTSENDNCFTWDSDYDSRFEVVAYFYQKLHNVKFRIKTKMLSLGTMYEASLVFRDLRDEPTSLMTIRWKINGLAVCSTHVAQRQVDNWFRFKMWHFWNHVPTVEFDIFIDEFPCAERHEWARYWIRGIEFQPVELARISFLNKYEHEGDKSLLNDNDDDMDNDEYWEKKLPENYQRYLKMSDKLQDYKLWDYATKKELYFIFFHGFLADNGQLWFSVCKSTHGICSLLSANKISSDDYRNICLSESRFSLVKQLGNNTYFLFKTTLHSVMCSPQYTYACYLLFKSSDNPRVLDNTPLFITECKLNRISMGRMISYWSTYPLNIPAIKSKNDNGSHGSSNILESKGLRMKKDRVEDLGYTRIQERKDGWMETMLFKLTSKLHDHKNGCQLRIELVSAEASKINKMIIEGIELRPYI